MPYVNTKAMIGALATYRLNVSGQISDAESSYICYISKYNSTLNINADGTSSSISVTK